jgi:hypothetical protein
VGNDAGGCDGELGMRCHGIKCSPVLGGYPALVPRTRKKDEREGKTRAELGD